VRVLLWSSAFWPAIGGAEILAVQLLHGLRERGVELAVVTDQNAEGTLPEVAALDGIPIHRFPFHATLDGGDPGPIGRLRAEARAVVRRFGPDLVHLHTLTPAAWFCRAALDAQPAKLLVTRHSLFEPRSRPVPDSLPILILRRADWIVCCSRAVLEETRAVLPECAPHSSVILNGLPRPRTVPPPFPDPPVLVGLGRQVWQKGFDLAVAALPDIRSRCPRARLVLIGDGPERTHLEAQSVALGVGDALELTGWVPPARVPERIGAASLVLVPSRAGEAFCLAALQAGQMGRPVVATRVGGLPELVLDGETGVLVEPDDPAALGRAAVRLLRHPEVLDRMGRRARSWTGEAFTHDRYIEEYLELYRRLVGGDPGRRMETARSR
jgi:glycogen(starch) synthase